MAGLFLHITRDFGPLRELLTAQDMADAGEMLIARIRTRTQAGLDVHGAGFAAYSERYAKQKEAALGHARVDLTVSGRMLNDMHVTAASATGATITFVSQGSGGGSRGGTFIQRSRAVGAADKAQWNNPTREFFGASDEDETAITAALDALLQKRFDAM